jgi:hypothetical protein
VCGPVAVNSEHDPEMDARALARAEEIRNDSKRMSAVRAHVEKMNRAIGAKVSKPRRSNRRGKERH